MRTISTRLEIGAGAARPSGRTSTPKAEDPRRFPQRTDYFGAGGLFWTHKPCGSLQSADYRKIFAHDAPKFGLLNQSRMMRHIGHKHQPRCDRSQGNRRCRSIPAVFFNRVDHRFHILERRVFLNDMRRTHHVSAALAKHSHLLAHLSNNLGGGAKGQ